MNQLQLTRISKTFGKQPILKQIDLQVTPGELLVFVGPSGSGKSTLLRIIAGLERQDAGQLWLNGKDISRQPPGQREMAMVFQSYALYPHMTVEENMGFALKMAGLARPLIEQKVKHVADMLQLTPLLARKPGALSGGQRQRVAIGRAIVRKPQLFLFDEPLSSLDAKLRGHTRVQIKTLHQQLGTTMIYVTHDQVEAMTLADRIVVLRDGEIAQIGTPQALYRRPASLFVAGFIGSPEMNFFPLDDQPEPGGWLPQPAPSGACTLGVRPDAFGVAPGAPAFQVDLVESTGAAWQLHGHLLAQPQQRAVVETRRPYAPGDRLALNVDQTDCHWFDRQGKRLDDAGLVPAQRPVMLACGE
ncbi:ABC transporter ATP-binding protein [Affinibrenneria salicis]|uniref:ABC transporter ATP-binding protein n=1 Tax=Affinibrenneria salicis TaxID=2590031 RepID=A0A5J5FTE4_9GAMM|nr:ABC transporter ATP-binding protein [Affinibrenneria salicis]KAA8996212.1 ABC transporter ATP-binding protein [Affinibrenneria salicis]